MINIDLSGKTAMVCGSTSGIGKAIAEKMAEAGASIVLCARNEEKLKSQVKVLEKLGKGIFNYVVADFEDNVSVSAAALLAADQYKPDILVNNTGGPPPGLAHEANCIQYLEAFKLHLVNNHILATALIPKMKKQKWGRIINVISTSVKVPLPNLGVSNTIRGAVGNWSKTMANELAQYGITVNNVLPGATATERLTGIIENKSNKKNIPVNEVTNEMLAEIPAGRFGSPNEPGYAAAFLASDLAAYINGTNLVVDGGRTPVL